MRSWKKAPLPPDWDAEPGAFAEAAAAPAPAVTVPDHPAGPGNGPSFSEPPPPPATGQIPGLSLPATGMISLNQWAAQKQLGAVRLRPLHPPAYSVPTRFGVFTVRPNSLSAFWGQVEVRLGFPPELAGDQIYLHTLDVQKILEPLANGESVALPATRLVVVDPGHGGTHTGTRNIVTGRYEKDYTLDWALRLAPLLRQTGWRVLLTRTNDVTLSLADRVAFAEAHHADLFLSLHFNSTGSGNGLPAGLETYYLPPVGMPSSITRGYADDLHASFPNNAYDTQNFYYALRLHTALLTVNGGKDRGVRRARFLNVLSGQQRPAVLIEGGYLSNPTEARQIADPAYRQKLALAVAQALE